MSSPPPLPSSPVKRPIGVSIAAIWSGLFAGLFPLALVLFFYFGPAQGSQNMSVGRLVLSVALAVGVVVSAVLAFRGARIGQIGLVVLVLVHYGLIAYQNYQLASAGIEVRGSTSIPWARVWRSMITAAIIGGYLLLSSKARAFFGGASVATKPG